MDSSVLLALIGLMGSALLILQIRANTRFESVKSTQKEIEARGEARLKELELRQRETAAQSALETSLTGLLRQSMEYQKTTADASTQTAHAINGMTTAIRSMTTRMEDWDDRTRETMATILKSFESIQTSLAGIVGEQDAGNQSLEMLIGVIEELRAIPDKTEAIVKQALAHFETLLVKNLAHMPVDNQKDMTL